MIDGLPYKASVIRNLNSTRSLVAVTVAHKSSNTATDDLYEFTLGLCIRASDIETGHLIRLLAHAIDIPAKNLEHLADTQRASYETEVAYLSEIIDLAKAGSEDLKIRTPETLSISFVRWCLRHLIRHLKYSETSNISNNIEMIWANLERSFRNSSEIVIYSEDHFKPIGHSVERLAFRLAEDRQLIPKKPTYTHGVPKPDNPFLFQHTVGNVRPITPAEMSDIGFYLHEPLGNLPVLTEDGWSLRLTDFTSRMLDDYFRTNQGPLIQIDPILRENCRSKIASMRIDPDKPFVILHVREPEFRPIPGHKSYTGTRNADLRTYEPAIQHLHQNGYNVFRMGAKSTSNKHIPNLLDYPNMPIKSDVLDIYLSENCEFCIGTSSGMSHVPLLFNKKILYTNWMPLGQYYYSRKSLTITKKLRSRTGSYLNFRESNIKYRNIYDTLFFKLQDISIEDNTPEEILAAVIDLEKESVHQDDAAPLRFRIADSFKKTLGLLSSTC